MDRTIPGYTIEPLSPTPTVSGVFRIVREALCQRCFVPSLGSLLGCATEEDVEPIGLVATPPLSSFLLYYDT